MKKQSIFDKFKSPIFHIEEELNKLNDALSAHGLDPKKFDALGAKIPKLDVLGGIATLDDIFTLESTKKAAVKYKKLPAPNEIAYWIEYNEYSKPQILLNGKRVLAKLRYNSENALIMSYLYGMPGKEISLQELSNHATHEPVKKTVHEIVNALGGKGIIRELFFKAYEDKIIFRKQVTYNDLENMNIIFNPKLITDENAY